ncbi:MAG: hypothetical protein ACRDRN_25765, partial [Sciscionella sp.]
MRAAILAAERSHRRARLRSEAEELLNDPDDVAASRELAAEMDVIRAWSGPSSKSRRGDHHFL